MSDTFAITPQRAQVINDYLKSEGENQMPAKGTIVFGKEGDESVFIRFEETADSYFEKVFTPETITNFGYFQCKVDKWGNKIEPACELTAPPTEDVSHGFDSTKVRILMAAISPSEISSGHSSILADQSRTIANLRTQLGIR